MTKIVKTIAVAILMAMSATMVAQNNEVDPGTEGNIVPYDVSFTVYPPLPQCNGTMYVTKAIIEVKLLWANYEVFKQYPPREMDKSIINNGYVFTDLFSCPGCAPAYIEYCIKGYDDFNYSGDGKLINSVSKKIPSSYPNNTFITILSNEWNGKCFGGSLSFPQCP